MTAALIAALLWAAQGLSPADVQYTRAMDLARAERWAEARAAFEAGRALAPFDKRFPLELAGLAFKQKNYARAKADLRTALSLDPGDSYAADFLATVYQLEGNTEAALKYWNRTGKPIIQDILVDPEPRLDPVLLDRAFAFSRAGELLQSDYETTQARLALLRAFPAWRFDLLPRDDGRFDLRFRPVERSRSWLSLLKGLPFQTIYPELHDIRGSGVDFEALFRWDIQKRRAWAELSGPVRRDPALRYRFFFDGRNENWVTPRLGGFNMEKAEAGVGFETVAGGRLAWSAAVSASDHRFRGISMPEGAAMKAGAAARYRLLELPERRFRVASRISSDVARMFGARAYAKGAAGLEAHWLPRARGNDGETSVRFRAGTSAGPLPFDELYMLGVERDSDLWLRAHPGTAGGRKGSAPLGRNFLLANWETDKTAYDAGLFAIKLGPFVDAGRTVGTKWMWDTGAQAKLKAPGGVTAVFIYGKDLRTGRNTFYVLLSP